MKTCISMLALLVMATYAQAQVVVQQSRGLFRNNSTVVVGNGFNSGANVVVNNQRGLFRNNSQVVVNSGFGVGASVFNGRRYNNVVVGNSFGAGYGYRQQNFFVPQRQVFLAPRTYYAPQLVQRTVYAAPPVRLQQQLFIPRQFSPGYAPGVGYGTGCSGSVETFAPQFAPQFAPVPGCASGSCGGGVQTFAPAAGAMLQRFGY